MSGIPLLVEAGALEVLVVGGGAVATRKARALRDAGARLRVVALSPCDEMLALAAEAAVPVTRRGYEPGDIAGADLVIAATDDREENARIARDARAAHRLVNVVDRGDGGTFVTMATHRSGPLVVGVGAGGVPAAAAHIRDAIAARFDARYGAALSALGAARRRLIDRGEANEWQARTAALLDPTFCERVEQGTVAEEVSSWR